MFPRHLFFLYDTAAVIVQFFSVGKGEAIETTLAALQVVPEPFRSFANTLVDICAYAGQSHCTLLPIPELNCFLLVSIAQSLLVYSSV